MPEEVQLHDGDIATRAELEICDLEHRSAFDRTCAGELNRLAQAQLGGRSELAIVPGATHLFEEPGTLDEVTRLARDWFVRYLKVRPGQ